MTSRDELLGYRESSMTFAGELSFLRRKVTRDISNADIVVSGIPFDSATTNRPGARFGPQAIRAASVQLAELADHAFPSKVNLFADLAIADYGDCELPSGYPGQVVERIFNHAQSLLLHDVMMVSLGGDHFVTYPLLQAHAEKYGPLSLLHFDAHVDTWEDDGESLDRIHVFTRLERRHHRA
jgi:agmatinase